MKKRKFVFLMGAVAAGAALSAWAILRGQSGIQYRTAPVQKGSVAYAVSASGNLNAVVTVQVGSQVSGNIMALYADYNSHVTKGQLIARIDPQLFQARVDQARATLNAAQSAVANAQATVEKTNAQLSSVNASVAQARANVVKAQAGVDNAKLNLHRQVALANEGIVSRQDRDTAQSNYNSAVAELEAAKAAQKAAEDNVSATRAELQVARTQVDAATAQVKQAKASLDQAETDLAHTYIYAPVDGVVVSRQVDVGQTVAASLQAPVLFQIAQDLTKMQVDTNVSEADIGRVQVGQQATFSVDAYPGKPFQGQVTSIRKAPINVQNVVTYDVVVAVANPELKLFPGMTANVNVLVDRHDDVLKVPNAALRYRPSNEESGVVHAARKGEQTVWVLDSEGKLRAVAVKTGLSDGSFTEIAGGDLKPGDQVVLAEFSRKAKAPAAVSPLGGGRSRRPF